MNCEELFLVTSEVACRTRIYTILVIILYSPLPQIIQRSKREKAKGKQESDGISTNQTNHSVHTLYSQ